MSSYASYCQNQAADCARWARLAKSPEVAIYYRGLGLRWLRLAEQARGNDASEAVLATNNATAACRQDILTKLYRQVRARCAQAQAHRSRLGM
jgi:hypothetical protein